MLASTDGNSASAFTLGSKVVYRLRPSSPLRLVCCWSQRSASTIWSDMVAAARIWATIDRIQCDRCHELLQLCRSLCARLNRWRCCGLVRLIGERSGAVVSKRQPEK